jgi:hypothetical protein
MPIYWSEQARCQLLAASSSPAFRSPTFLAPSQGTTRYERAHNYVQSGHATAAALQTSYAWAVIDVPSVGHDGKLMYDRHLVGPSPEMAITTALAGRSYLPRVGPMARAGVGPEPRADLAIDLENFETSRAAAPSRLWW